MSNLTPEQNKNGEDMYLRGVLNLTEEQIASLEEPTLEQIQSGEDHLRNVLGCTEEEIAALGKKIPEGLVKCEVCGEYSGKVMEKDLNWDDSFDKENKEKSEEYLSASCLCVGIPCPECKKNKIRRPISNFYDKKDNSLWHSPYFSGMMPCEECRKKKQY